MNANPKTPHPPGPASHPPLAFAIDGMTCENCARQITEAIQRLPGVLQATVTLQTSHALVRWQPDATPDPAAVAEAVARAGFRAQPVPPHPTTPANSVGSWKTGLLLAIAAMVWFLFGEWIAGWHAAPWFRWTALGLATFVQLGPARPFYLGAWTQLKAGRSNMDTLVALGSTTAYLYSVVVLLSGQPGHLYFMEAVAIIALVSLGHWLEARTSAKASQALQSLLHLAPELARQAVELVHQLRNLDLKKSPSISETLDWARALVQLNAKQLDEKTVETTLTVLLKHETDIIRAKRALARRGTNGGASKPGPSGFDPDDMGSYRTFGRK